ncbi:DUF5518 domain-containing protein [Natrarchaeobaculum aegyptiacum]|uniref:DUF5518 domain-containing protein n=1 Tax=Natrarchaeobaculum aegyptiacum TaxID=745377 RepID=A0A2Z2HRJ2_9EURY|nr:DUF5518 domain-containing protein [Natrarchaeobaculum aegyptiacum]ARS89699.1 hypothetical protein B1756_08070 [Natrarchaeobaculum aegyptiacum]
MSTHGTLVHAIVGAIVGILLSFIPFSTVIGGAVAGFLEGPNHRDGALAGALAGAITFLPAAGIALLALAFVGFGTAFAAIPIEGAAVLFVGVVLAFATILIYTVGLALVGGFLGAALAREYPDRRVSTRRSIGLSDRPRGARSSDGSGAQRPPQDSNQWTGRADDPQPWDDAHEPRTPSGPRSPPPDHDLDEGSRGPGDQARWHDECARAESDRADRDADPETDRE